MSVKSRSTGTGSQDGAWGHIAIGSDALIDLNRIGSYFENEMAARSERERSLVNMRILCCNGDTWIQIGTYRPEETQNDKQLIALVEKLTADICKIIEAGPLAGPFRKESEQVPPYGEGPGAESDLSC
jgi:hypothetical protein